MKNFVDLKIAIVRDQLTQYGGAERTLEAILDIFPQADIFVGINKPINLPEKILKQRVFASKMPSWLSFLMPFVYEHFDLRQYDIVISEGTAWPKGVLTHPGQLHISYIYTPPRFLYGYATEGQKRDRWYFKPFLKIVDHFLLMWDYCAGQRPDFILSISQEVAKRVQKFYGRQSTVIYPPVELGKTANNTNKSNLQETRPPAEHSQSLSGPAQSRAPQIPAYGHSLRDHNDPLDDYYLCISRLAAYKKIDLLIEAFKLTNLKLKIAGTGKEEERLRKLALAKTKALTEFTTKAEPRIECEYELMPKTQNIELLGFVTNDQKQDLLANCKGFIFPTDYEDFGIAPVEALSYGKAVLCHRSGGPLEIVQEGITGMFFDDLTPQGLSQKIVEFDKNIDAGLYDNQKSVELAKKFSAERFKQEFGNYIKQKWEELQNAGTS